MGKSLPSAPLQLILAKVFSEIFRKIQRSTDRPDRRRPLWLSLWRLRRGPLRPEALATEPTADRRGPSRRRHPVCVWASVRPRAAEEPSASRLPSVRRALPLGASGMPGLRLGGAPRMKPSSPDLLYHGSEVSHARARSFCRLFVHGHRHPYISISMSVSLAFRLILWIAADKVNAFSLMFCLSR